MASTASVLLLGYAITLGPWLSIFPSTSAAFNTGSDILYSRLAVPLSSSITAQPSKAYGGNPMRQQLNKYANKNGVVMARNDLNDELNEASQRAAEGGVGETAAGAILGGLILGPFGALFGANIGATVGRKNAVNRARQEKMAEMGLTEEMLQLAEESGKALNDAIEGRRAVKESWEAQKRLAQRLEADSVKLMAMAKEALESDNDETRARELLFQRQQIQDRLKQCLKECVDAKLRFDAVDENVGILETRATEVEALLRRSVSAKRTTTVATTTSIFELEQEDPLLQKFRDMGID